MDKERIQAASRKIACQEIQQTWDPALLAEEILSDAEASRDRSGRGLCQPARIQAGSKGSSRCARSLPKPSFSFA